MYISSYNAHSTYHPYPKDKSTPASQRPPSVLRALVRALVRAFVGAFVGCSGGSTSESDDRRPETGTLERKLCDMDKFE